jgi:hypothetical protein
MEKYRNIKHTWESMGIYGDYELELVCSQQGEAPPVMLVGL